jgi:hypothetical protein
MKSTSEKIRGMVLERTGKTPSDIVRRARRGGAFVAIAWGDGAKCKLEAWAVQRIAS